ncbi:ATP-binding protein [Nocardia goodfellowii]|uniref:Anti-sigma regulatory factor (Ser/Thr protein kinase) n=1 Tax=Nocardia goodfellowii TaxID=882446 RepID=A0ABS4QGQ3_9NOCA|nr:ATP-binding protein [Nocardia goodfellowii]MBP2190875.1 anti-sigma regulatory factor (Ser/Thr protein kinase) [Nocardia goodfellowii]
MTNIHRPAPLDLIFPAEPTRLAEARRALREWLADRAVDSDQAYNILAATDEACANAIEHGCRDRQDGSVRLRVCADADYLRVTVRDNGHWKPPTPQHDNYRGRGLNMMRALMDQVNVQPTRDGTVVDMHTKLSTTARRTADNRGLVSH